MGKVYVVIILFLSLLTAAVSQSSIDLVCKTAFRQVDWEGNYVWKDMQGTVILMELVESDDSSSKPVYANSDEAISHANGKQVQFLRRYLDYNQLVYRLHRNGYVLVEDRFGNAMGKYIKDSNENLVFQKLPRRPNFVSSQRCSF